MGSVHNQIITNQNHTQQYKATLPKSNSTTVDSNAFLQLLTQQLQYQDPLNPMDNTDMLAQEAQFATLEQMESLTSSFTKFSNAFQANSLLGQIVEIEKTDGGTTTGLVEYVDYTDAKGASVSVNGTLHPINNIKKVYPTYIYDDTPKDETNNKDEVKDDKTAGENMLDAVSENIPKLAKQVSNYMDKN